MSLSREAARTAPRYALSTIAWPPVVPNPDKVMCIGLNYDDHRKESGCPTVIPPTVFARFSMPPP